MILINAFRNTRHKNDIDSIIGVISGNHGHCVRRNGKGNDGRNGESENLDGIQSVVRSPKLVSDQIFSAVAEKRSTNDIFFLP